MLKTRKCQKIKICKVLEKLISHQKKKKPTMQEMKTYFFGNYKVCGCKLKFENAVRRIVNTSGILHGCLIGIQYYVGFECTKSWFNIRIHCTVVTTDVRRTRLMSATVPTCARHPHGAPACRRDVCTFGPLHPFAHLPLIFSLVWFVHFFLCVCFCFF